MSSEINFKKKKRSNIYPYVFSYITFFSFLFNCYRCFQGGNLSKTIEEVTYSYLTIELKVENCNLGL